MQRVLGLLPVPRARFWLLASLYVGSELACAGTVPAPPQVPAASTPTAAATESAEPPNVSPSGQARARSVAQSSGQQSSGQSSPASSSLVEFIGMGRGDHVADLGAGVGYSVLAWVDAVGPSGVVYARQDPRTPRDLPRAEPSADPLPDNLVLLRTSLAAPLTASAAGLDDVVFLFAYSDLLAPAHDPRAFHAAIYRAMKAGGTYVVGEHGTLPTPGFSRGSERVSSELIRRDVEATGFRFVEAAEPEPPSATAATSAATSANIYLLKFRKPE